MRVGLLTIAVLALFAANGARAPAASETAYAFDTAGSDIGFVVRHHGIWLLKGRFNDFEGVLTIDPARPEQAEVEVTIRTASVDTGLSFVDGHLRSPVLFDVERHPTMTFKSTQVEVTGRDSGQVRGELTLLGITHPMVLDVTLGGVTESPDSPPDTAVFTATGTMSRAAFGMDWGPSGFAEQVDINIEVAVRRP